MRHNPEKRVFRGRSHKKGGERVAELRESEERVVAIPKCSEDWAYTGIVTSKGYFIGRADRNVRGYTPVPVQGSFKSYDEAQAKADELNEARGMSKVEALKIVFSSMR
jgi:hypothetical protein